MNDKNSFDRRALLSLGTVTILAPALRFFVTASTELAGRAAWLTAPAALPVLAVYVLFLSALMDKRNDGENLSDLALRILGNKLGKAFLLITTAWLILYAGFELRSGSDRLIVTVYPNSVPAAFSVVMGIVALAAVLGTERTIVRSARIILPVVIGTLLLVLFFALFSVSADNLLPITVGDILPVLEGSVSAIDVVSVGAYTLCFFEGCTPRTPHRRRDYILWVTSSLLLLTLLSTAIIGVFGAEITRILTRPFFVLVRNLVFFRTVERVEALIVMLWIFPDFLQVSLLLFSAQYALRRCIGKDAAHSGGVFDFSEGRYLIWLCCLAAVLIAVFIAPDSLSMYRWSQKIIPLLNLGYGFLLLPILYIVGKVKKRI